jgi:hypothetical protein
MKMATAIIPTLHPYIGETLTGGNRARKQANTASLLSNPAVKKGSLLFLILILEDRFDRIEEAFIATEV